MPNQLANETSPYLLQHAQNPVDWYPWGPEALERARRENKPIFLSIGYSACHWCHVMEHESFENDTIARQLNADFVCIKVDREERPDLDQIYMNAVQIMTGHGGWPMSVFLTPDLKPFFGGTYWPPVPSRGMPGFGQVLEAVVDAWVHRRDRAIAQADELTQHLKSVTVPPASDHPLTADLLLGAAKKLEQVFDFTHGGFGTAPKFPHPTDLQVLLRAWYRTRQQLYLEMVQLNLDKMGRGGIYDHLAGGFARYSVDERWLVPHFEKMLYDNALLSGAYLDAFRATGNADYLRIARETLDYVLRDMTDSTGAFHSTEDADSEGEEGKFYVWTPEEIHSVLGPEAGERFCYVYDVTPAGNFEKQNILNLAKTIQQCAQLRGWNPDELEQELVTSRQKLLAVRNRRVRPGKDDKVLVSWNALMIDTLARFGGVVSESRYIEGAERAARFILSDMRQENGRLWHSWRHGIAKFPAYLDDYSYLIQALVSLYENTGDDLWIDEAVPLAEVVLRHFWNEEQGAFYFTADDHEELILRHTDYYDGSVPSGNAMAATALIRLGTLAGRNDFKQAAEATIRSALGLLARTPTAAGQMLVALDFYLGPVTEIVLVANPQTEESQEILQRIHSRFLPHALVAHRNPEAIRQGSRHLSELFAGKEIAHPPAAFFCEGFTCHAPVVGPTAILDAVERLGT